MSSRGLLSVLLPRARRAILAELLRSPEERLHLRELERRTGLNAKELMRELHSLTDAGILHARRSGNRVYYRANKRCPIYPELRMLIMKTTGLAEFLRGLLAPLAERVELAYVYGSHATGEARPDSDIDLMIVGTVTLADTATPLAEAERTLEQEINPTVYTPEEYWRKVKEEDGFAARVHDGARVTVIGETDAA